MSLRKHCPGVPLPPVVADGILGHDFEILTKYQRACVTRLGKTYQLEQEAYLSQHPEVSALLELFVGKVVHDNVPTPAMNMLKTAGKFFTRPTEELDTEIREYLGLPATGPYLRKNAFGPFKFIDYDLLNDLKKIMSSCYPPPKMRIPRPTPSSLYTQSSSYISLISSDTTQPTPEPIPTPEQTVSEAFFIIVSNTVDKAVYLHVDEGSLRYDTAYVELMKSVEEAMEVPVIEIREDLAELLFKAYEHFEDDILEKERIAAELAWERRMRKKMKRTLRRANNFRGYESKPLTPYPSDTELEEIKKPPPRPCVCHPQYHFNRYPKDRFGIYLPGVITYPDVNATTTPVYSVENIVEAEGEAATDTKATDAKSVDKKSARGVN